MQDLRGYPISYASGANYPKMIIKEYLLDEIINFEEHDSDKLFLRYENHRLLIIQKYGIKKLDNSF